jgi:hypothetical protein
MGTIVRLKPHGAFRREATALRAPPPYGPGWPPPVQPGPSHADSGPHPCVTYRPCRIPGGRDEEPTIRLATRSGRGITGSWACRRRQPLRRSRREVILERNRSVRFARTAATAVIAVLLLPATANASEPGTIITAPVRDALAQLPAQSEDRTGYERSKFRRRRRGGPGSRRRGSPRWCRRSGHQPGQWPAGLGGGRDSWFSPKCI